MSNSHESSQIDGTLSGNVIRWKLAALEYQGKIADACRRINTGKIRNAGKLQGSFTACRVPAPAGELKGTLQVEYPKVTSGACAAQSITTCDVATSFEFTEDMLDALDRSGVPNEALQVWRDREASVSTAPRHAQPLLPPSVRDGLIRKMEEILKESGAPERWYSAVSLLDTYAGLFADDRLIGELPLTCMAVLRSVRSIDCATEYTPSGDYAEHASHISQWLHSTGHVAEAPTVTVQQINDQEMSIFNRLQGIRSLPTARDWLFVLFVRLNLLTQYKYMTPIAHAWNRCNNFVKMCTLKLDATDPNFLPSRVACGLLGHSLVAVRLLPVGALQPPCVDCQEWETLFAASQPDGSGAALPCVLALDCLTAFVQHLQATSGANLTVLKQDSLHMARFMRDSFQELRASNRAGGVGAA